MPRQHRVIYHNRFAKSIHLSKTFFKSASTRQGKASNFTGPMKNNTRLSSPPLPGYHPVLRRPSPPSHTECREHHTLYHITHVKINTQAKAIPTLRKHPPHANFTPRTPKKFPHLILYFFSPPPLKLSPITSYQHPCRFFLLDKQYLAPL